MSSPPFPERPTVHRPYTPALAYFAFSYMGIVEFIQYGHLTWSVGIGAAKMSLEGQLQPSAAVEELGRYKGDLGLIAYFFIGAPGMRDDPNRVLKLWLDVAVGRMVDVFNAYIASMLRSILVARPQILRSVGAVDVSEVLECATIPEFVKRLADKKVDALARRGFTEVRDYLDKILGIKLAVDAQNASNAIALRHVIVHNEGRADAQFLSETHRTDVEIGKEVPLSLGDLVFYVNGLVSVAFAIDKACVTKFGPETFGTGAF